MLKPKEVMVVARQTVVSDGGEHFCHEDCFRVSEARAFIKLFRAATFATCRAHAAGLRPCLLLHLLKRVLVEIFGETKKHQLLQACDLGDRKPTELLAEMRKLLGAKGSHVVLKKLFMDRLPSNVDEFS